MLASTAALLACLHPATAQTTFSADTTTARQPTPTVVYCPPAEGRNAFRFQRYTWDASLDASFVLPSFYTITYNGLYNYNSSGHNYFNYNGYSYGSTGVFNNIRSTSLLLRRNETVMNRTNIPLRKGAYRFTLSLSGSNQMQQTDSIHLPGTVYGFLIPIAGSYHHIGASLGYEWQEQLGRFQLYYGYAAGLSYNRSQQTSQLYNSNNSIPERSEVEAYDEYIGVGITPLAGVKFFIHSRFSMGMESSFALSYYRRDYNSLIANNAFISQKFTSRGFSYGFMPVSAFNATFHFGSTVR